MTSTSSAFDISAIAALFLSTVSSGAYSAPSTTSKVNSNHKIINTISRQEDSSRESIILKEYSDLSSFTSKNIISPNKSREYKINFKNLFENEVIEIDAYYKPKYKVIGKRSKQDIVKKFIPKLDF